jgi:hypothetical protein
VPSPVVRRKLFDLFAVTDILIAQPFGGRWPWQTNGAALPRAYLVPGSQWAFEVVEDEVDVRLEIATELSALARLESIDPRREVLLHEREAAASMAEAVYLAEDREPFRPIEITSRSPNRLILEFETDRPAILVVSDPYFPGWRASDGEQQLRVMRANVLFRAVAVEAGAHRVVFEYCPAAWVIGRRVTLASLFIITSMLLFGSWRLRRNVP